MIRVQRSLCEIDPLNRKLITLCFFDARPVKEVAVELKMTPQQVRRQLSAATYDARDCLTHTQDRLEEVTSEKYGQRVHSLYSEVHDRYRVAERTSLPCP